MQRYLLIFSVKEQSAGSCLILMINCKKNRILQKNRAFYFLCPASSENCLDFRLLSDYFRTLVNCELKLVENIIFNLHAVQGYDGNPHKQTHQQQRRENQRVIAIGNLKNQKITVGTPRPQFLGLGRYRRLVLGIAYGYAYLEQQSERCVYVRLL